MKFTEQEMKNFQSFLIETFEFTEEQQRAIDFQTQMTQEIYNSLLDRCIQIGQDADPTFFRMLETYPNLLEAYAQKNEGKENNVESVNSSNESKTIC